MLKRAGGKKKEEIEVSHEDRYNGTAVVEGRNKNPLEAKRKENII